MNKKERTVRFDDIEKVEIWRDVSIDERNSCKDNPICCRTIFEGCKGMKVYNIKVLTDGSNTAFEFGDRIKNISNKGLQLKSLGFVSFDAIVEFRVIREGNLMPSYFVIGDDVKIWLKKKRWGMRKTISGVVSKDTMPGAEEIVLSY